MKFTPQTEAEIEAQAAYKLLKPGEYDFEVVLADEILSKAGNAYISLRLKVWDDLGQERLVFTHLAFAKLLKHFCDITNMQDKYNAGEISPDDCVGKSGRAVIGVEIGKKKPDGTFYPDKNVVMDYIKATSNIMQQKKDDSFESDEIPF